jgi:hypothetical protein
MWTLPQGNFEKIGFGFYMLAVSIGTALLTSAACLVLGIAISLTAQAIGWIHPGEYQPWLPIIGLEYGFLLGIVVGAFVCCKVWRTRLNG